MASTLSISASATDIPGSCPRGCSFSVHVGGVRQYKILVSWNSAGGSSSGPIVSGMNVDKNFSMAAGSYTVHAQYLDGSTYKDAAYLNCSPQIKLSFRTHPKCEDYNEAWVTVTQN